jgi:hypothetical protein
MKREKGAFLPTKVLEMLEGSSSASLIDLAYDKFSPAREVSSQKFIVH